MFEHKARNGFDILLLFFFIFKNRFHANHWCKSDTSSMPAYFYLFLRGCQTISCSLNDSFVDCSRKRSIKCFRRLNFVRTPFKTASRTLWATNEYYPKKVSIMIRISKMILQTFNRRIRTETEQWVTRSSITDVFTVHTSLECARI